MGIVVKRLFTADEYRRMTEGGILAEDDRVELIGGEIVQMSPIGSGHAGQVMWLTSAFHRSVGTRAIVSVQNPVALGEYAEPQPDIALLRPRNDFYRHSHPGPADVLLLVEVCDSSAAYDREIKVPLYGEAAIPAVWLIDMAMPGVVEVYESPEARGFRRVRRASRGETLTVPDLPGASIPVDDVLG